MSTYAVSTSNSSSALVSADSASEIVARAARAANGGATVMVIDEIEAGDGNITAAPAANGAAVAVKPGHDPSRIVKLTKREVEVLTLVIEGNSSKEVADHLYVSKRTVDFHLANIYHKLGVTNRVQAFREATRRGLIPFNIVGSSRQ